MPTRPTMPSLPAQAKIKDFAIKPLDADNAEGDSGNTAFTFEITRSSGSGPGSVQYAVTGAELDDFAGATSGTVNFLNGETSKIITIQVAGDTLIEANQDFTVTLSNPSAGSEIATASAIGTIQNDDHETYQLSIAPLAAVKAEGNSGTTEYTFTVTRGGGTADGATVDYAVTGTGGLNATDFGGTFPSGTVTFAVGDDAKTITIEVAGDSTVELDENFTVSLSNASSNAQIVEANKTATRGR